MHEFILAQSNLKSKEQELMACVQGTTFKKKATQKKYEYDSDEEIDEEGTWEHKLRRCIYTFTHGFFVLFI